MAKTLRRTITNSMDSYRDGVYTLKDVRGDITWLPVQAVEDHRSHDGKLFGTVNHLDYDEAVTIFNNR